MGKYQNAKTDSLTIKMVLRYFVGPMNSNNRDKCPVSFLCFCRIFKRVHVKQKAHLHQTLSHLHHIYYRRQQINYKSTYSLCISAHKSDTIADEKELLVCVQMSVSSRNKKNSPTPCHPLWCPHKEEIWSWYPCESTCCMWKHLLRCLLLSGGNNLSFLLVCC